MVTEIIWKELQKTVTVVNEIDDVGSLDEKAEYEAWKLRELKRTKRDKEREKKKSKTLNEDVT
ncbi:38805_t:CDS:2 [Gigaspora margarita]|uniref:38805_t:CDS:1 n=1 Tax=Gigaspora margarita TaxID=4874 RepID=A0ABN7UKR6_GIGMA|nr:38805_t:CDS:2 [Gigaspora margarita]